MPTYDDPVKDAAELSEAARGLAHASRQFDDPADSYPVLGELQSTLIRLHQSVQQLASLHTRLADRAATDDGDRAAGREHALVAAVRLEAAATHIDRATDQLMAGFAENGRIAWQSTPGIAGEMLTERAARLEPDTLPGPSGPADPSALGR